MLNIEIFYHFAESEHQKAWLVRSIGDRTAEMFDLEVPGNGYRSKQAWEAQEWLNVEETCAEQFLNQFSVLNCFQSQILLSQAPSLRQLFKMPLNELLERYSLWIPERSLTMWFDLLRAELVM